MHDTITCDYVPGEKYLTFLRSLLPQICAVLLGISELQELIMTWSPWMWDSPKRRQGTRLGNAETFRITLPNRMTSESAGSDALEERAKLLGAAALACSLKFVFALARGEVASSEELAAVAEDIVSGYSMIDDEI